MDSKALKEEIINAMVHNDYSSRIPPVFEIFSDRFTIASYGGLPQEITQEDFFNDVSAPRNKELMRVFKDVDLIENIGSGVLRILDAYDKSCFKFMDHFLRVSFKYKENPFEYETNNKQKNDKINDKEKQILSLLMNNLNYTIPEISKITKILTATISRCLKQLQYKKIIERVGSNKSEYWKIIETGDI